MGVSRKPTSRVAPWTLIDTPLGWAHRSAVVDLLEDAEARRRESETRAAAARHEAEVARWEHRRLKNRRAVRVTNELANARRRSPSELPRRLRAAMEPRDAGPPPTPSPAALQDLAEAPDIPSEADPEALADAAEAAEVRVEHPHLRVLHLGVAARFANQATHTVVDPDRWKEQLEDGWDLVLIEPEGEAWDPTGGALPDLLAAARAQGIVTARIRPPWADATGPGEADLELREGPGGDLPASVDTSVFNPAGYDPTPPDPVAVLLETRPDPRVVDLLAAFDPPVLALQPPDLSVPEAFDRRRRIRTPQIHARAMRRAGVLLDHPSFHACTADMLRAWAAAVACGTPVVALEPDVDTLPPGVLGVDADAAVDVVHGLLTDADRRERLSIHGRREALAHASRQQAFRKLADAADIPLPAQPRTTVVMATHRADFLDHALDSVARQTQPDVDLVLVLHGDAFDGVDPSARGVEVSTVVRAPSRWMLGDALNAGVDRATGQLIAKMDDDDYYGDEHLRDLVLAQRYSGAEVVGKRIEFVYMAGRDVTLRRGASRPERDRPHVGGPTILAEGETLRRLRFLRLPSRVDSTLYERVLAEGGRVYRTHSRDLVLQRHGSGHAWERDDEDFLDEAVATSPGLDLDLAATTPLP
jgi:hypothetical protein